MRFNQSTQTRYYGCRKCCLFPGMKSICILVVVFLLMLPNAGKVPHCCKKNPIVVDLLPGVPYNQQFSNCCKAGVMSAWGQDPTGSVSAFQVSVGLAGTSNKTVKLPKNFNLLGPGLGYTCGPAKVVPSTVYLTPDRRRKTQALSKHFFTCKCNSLPNSPQSSKCFPL